MDVPSSVERFGNSGHGVDPLLMEPGESRNEHAVDMRSTASSSSLLHLDESSSNHEFVENQDRRAAGAGAPASQSSVPSGNSLNGRSSSAGRSGDAHRRRNPLNTGLWISVELALTMSQITVSIIVLSVSQDEHPRAPLFLWIVGYATGCFATLPLLYWRYRNRNQLNEQDGNQARTGTPQINVPAGAFSVSVSRSSDVGDHHAAAISPRTSQ